MMFFQKIVSSLRAAFVLSALPLTVMNVLPTSAKAASLNFDQIYAFGDSLSDNGNLYSADGQTYPPSPPYFEGRFSNGPVWVEQLATMLGVPLSDFALGGSSTGLNNLVIDNPQLPGLLAQVQNFTSSPAGVDPNGLYAVWGGANDYIFGQITDPIAAVNTSVSNIEKAVTQLATAGAKNILVVNLPDLGKIPVVSNQPALSSGLTTLSQFHDLSLGEAVDSLSKTLGLSVHITSLDVNSLFSEVIADPGKFGLTDVTDACFPSLALNPVPCANPNQYFFWDEYHPTTAVDKIIANAAYSQLSVPEPSDALGILAIGAVGGVLVLTRKPKS